MTSPKIPRNLVSLGLCLILTLTACGVAGGLNLVPATLTPTPSQTPTATLIPLAVSVNGEGITILEFDAELARYQQAQTALGNTVSQEAATKAVSDEFIDTLLLAQGAAAKGYHVDDAALQSRIDSLAAQAGGPEALTTWETAHGYTDATFRSDLRRQMADAYMRDQLTASVPTTAEQVHVKQILLSTTEAAQQALGYLKAGWNFNDLATQYDPVTNGELGWFPRGYLSDSAIEAAAFALQPGQYSDIIQSQAGYDILFMVARDPARALSPDALLTLQEHAVLEWLTQQRKASTILFAP
ncbi:MAG: SurA N-terminal domain-containing protein [Anaerolineales bacterium]|jgi:peptidyl-prolyl cis-trans isomerase C